MTIGGALSELNNLLNADDIPCYYKASIKAVMDTITLEQEPILDKIRAEIVKKHLSIVEKNGFDSGRTYGYEEVLDIIDKYKAESEDKE